LLYCILSINSKDYYNKEFKFGFDFNKECCSFYAPDLKLIDNEEKKKYFITVTIKNIDDLPEDSMSGNVKEEFINKKRLLEKGKFNYGKTDTTQKINMAPIIKKSNNINYASFMPFWHSSSSEEGRYIKKIEGNIFFFKKDTLIVINIEFLNGFLPKFIENKSVVTYKKYFKPFVEYYGAEFKNNNSAEKLYNDIINMNKELPEDLLLFYKCFNQIVDTLVIK
jgi:hypothetical protein